MRIAAEITLTETEEKELKRFARGRRTEVRIVCRAKIILAAARGLLNSAIATELGVDPNTVGRWRTRFAEKRIAGLVKDLPRGGRPSREGGAVASLIIERTTQSKPANATHWSTRSLAKELGLTQSMVHRVWKANGLKPHLIKTSPLRAPRKLGGGVKMT